MLEAEALGLHRGFPAVGPEAVIGIEINPYAAELARLTVWIGEIQWMLGHGYSLNDQPILKPLNSIECRDALLTPLFPNPSPTKGEGSAVREADWPAAEVIVGNPPFLGDKKQLAELGDEYAGLLRRVYQGRVPGGADLVCYWFEKARAQIEAGQAQRAGLVTTNSIRGGQNRKVLDRIRETGTIFNAWSDLEWINEGAAVRVSLVSFGQTMEKAMLNGQPVAEIYADLTGQMPDATGGVDLTEARMLPENAGVSFIGTSKKGRFDVPGEQARSWLQSPNPHGRGNHEVLKPWVNGMDVTRRPSDMWIVDFGMDMPEVTAACFELPFAHVLQAVKPARDQVRNLQERRLWWLHARTLSAMRAALSSLPRYIATPRVAKYRLFTLDG